MPPHTVPAAAASDAAAAATHGDRDRIPLPLSRMPPSFDLADWWNREGHQGIPVVVKMENPNWSMLELESPRSKPTSTDSGAEFVPDKDRGKNAKQLTWVLLLKAHRAAGCLAWMAQGLWLLMSAIRKRLILRQGVSVEKPQRVHRFFQWFLAVALILLVFEAIAHYSGWHFNLNRASVHIPTNVDVHSLLHSVYTMWVYARATYIAPPLQTLADLCIVLFMIQSADRLLLCLGCAWIKLRRIRYTPPPAVLQSDDVENPGSGHPMVLAQIPMCNEREVYSQSISAVCQLDWPRHRLLVQVLDDSDDPDTQLLIQAEVQKWRQKGVNILYRHRRLRTGYKAGNLNSAMTCDYVKDYEFVAIFDADFQPKPDFLKLTVPHFKDNPELALVQSRWAFTNKAENLLTRFQNINLSFHFEVEQQVNGVFLNFFGFNGTAGVWRIKALEESGGWLERTTVEDMDIAVRAHLQGWKFIFLNDVQCLCELPESYEAYRKQQHRWHSGPMQLFRLCFPDIIKAKIPFWKKGNLIFLFFLLRKLILPFYSFTLFCIILPMTMFVPEAHLPVWVICYIPVIMSVLNVLPAPSSCVYMIPYLVFENTMSVTKFNAMISGLFQLGSAYEWVVTKKTGRSSASEADLLAYSTPEEALPMLQRGMSESEVGTLAKLQDLPAPPSGPVKKKKRTNRLYRMELTLAFLLLTAAARTQLIAQGIHFYFLLFQGLSFLVIGLDLIGEQVS